MEITDTDILNYIEKNPKEFGLREEYSYQVFNIDNPNIITKSGGFVDLRTKAKKLIEQEAFQEEQRKQYREKFKAALGYYPKESSEIS